MPRDRAEFHVVEPLPSREELCRDGSKSIAGACAFTNLSRSKIYELIRRGLLHKVRIDGKTLVLTRELVDLLAQNVEGLEGE